MEAFNMQQLRRYDSDVWYEVTTAINNNEPVFFHRETMELFEQVFRETEKRFQFDVRGLTVSGSAVTFYIRLADGSQLPSIIKWLKQTFAARFNTRYQRRGHLWANRAKITPWTGQEDEPADSASFLPPVMPIRRKGQRGRRVRADEKQKPPSSG
jgi:REP element-mobilizing transposase RayT